MPIPVVLIDSDGDELTLEESYRVRMLDGIGMPPVEHRTERGPYQDGETYLGSVLRPRVLTFDTFLTGATELSVWQCRDVMLELLLALQQGFHARVTRPDGSQRQIQLRYLAGLEMAIDHRNWTRYQPAAFQAVAYNPLWYNPTATVWAYSLSGGVGSFGFPLGFPAGFGSTAVDVRETRQYAGTWKAHPRIHVTGPIDNLVIENETTGEKLDFTGYSLGDGESLDIDLRYGHKTVKDGAGLNLIDKLTTDSDLATWHIAAHPEAIEGDNVMRVRGTGATAATAISIQFFTQYGGI